jgi:hypothetical protein
LVKKKDGSSISNIFPACRLYERRGASTRGSKSEWVLDLDVFEKVGRSENDPLFTLLVANFLNIGDNL